MAKNTPYTPEQRDLGVKLAVEHGVETAMVKFKETYPRGVIRSTLRKWISLAGEANNITEGRQKMIDAHVQEFEMRRAALKVRILDEAEAFLADMRKDYTTIVVDQRGAEHELTLSPLPTDRAKLATGFGILFDKLQLATGGSTSNQTVQNPSLTALVQQQQQKNETVKAELVAAAAEGVSE